MATRNPVRELLESMLKRIDHLESRVDELTKDESAGRTVEVTVPHQSAIFSMCQPTCTDEAYTVMEYVYETQELRRKK